MGDTAQLQAPGSTAKDTINARVIPIVMVPGVMGTRLDISGTIADWDPDSKAVMAEWGFTSGTDSVRSRIDFRTKATPMTDLGSAGEIAANKRLAAIGTRGLFHSEVTTRRIVGEFYTKRGWGELVWSFYGPILMHLQEFMNPGPGIAEPHPVYAVGYDWRQSNMDSGPFLNRRIGDVLKAHPLAKQVVVVTHSMGGLVTRSALAQGGQAQIAGVVHTVMPSDGAVVAYRRFFTGADDDLDPGDGFLGTVGLNSILGNSPEEYLETQSGAQGPIELLPHDSYPDVFFTAPDGRTNRDFTDIFKTYELEKPPGIIPEDASGLDTIIIITQIQNRLRKAKKFSRLVAGIQHPNTALLLGDGLATDMVFDWRKGKDDPKAGAIKRNQGDGTVPAPSAEFRAATVHSRDRFPVGHAECFKNLDFCKKTKERLDLVLTKMP